MVQHQPRRRHLRLPGGPHLRRPLGAAAMTLTAAVLLAAAVVAWLPGSAPAAVACRVDYGVNQWATGFTAQVTITNNAAPVTGWTLTWTFPGDQRITSAWNAQVAQNAAAVTARDAGFNGALGTGASTSFGFQATYSGQNATPGDFALNGTPCGDVPTQSPTGTPTASPTASPTVTPTVTPTASPTVTPTFQPTDTICSVALCDSFEGQAGATPTGSWQPSFPDCQGTGAVAVDHTVAHSGSTSLRVDGGSGYCNHAFALNTTMVPAVGSPLFVRVYVRHTTALPDGHVAFATLTDAADGNRHLRLGGQNRALQWNRESDDATLPEQSPAGVALSAPLPVNQWSCLEFMIDQSQGTMSTWLNGTEVPGLHLDQTPTHDIDSQWLGRANWRPRPVDLRLGWESYAGGTDTLWFDDLVVSSSRFGC
ncbi:MAG TPA: cellulose-binding domain-containing protein [Streptosporangiaceae bacterium]